MNLINARRSITMLVMTFLMVISVGLLLVWQDYNACVKVTTQLPFDRSEWIESSHSRRGITFDRIYAKYNGSPRVYMIRDIEERHLREGMTTDEVQELLGAPDFMSEPRKEGLHAPLPGVEYWIYTLQPDPRKVERSSFIVSFDENRRYVICGEQVKCHFFGW